MAVPAGPAGDACPNFPAYGKPLLAQLLVGAQWTVALDLAVDQVNVIALPGAVERSIPEIFLVAAALSAVRLAHMLEDLRLAHAG